MVLLSWFDLAILLCIAIAVGSWIPVTVNLVIDLNREKTLNSVLRKIEKKKGE